jgi:hypothetical protein
MKHTHEFERSPNGDREAGSSNSAKEISKFSRNRIVVEVPPKSRFGIPRWYLAYQEEARRLVTENLRTVEAFREACKAAYDPILKYRIEDCEKEDSKKEGDKKFSLPDDLSDRSFEGIVTYLRRFLSQIVNPNTGEKKPNGYRTDHSRLQLIMAVLRSAEAHTVEAEKKINEERRRNSKSTNKFISNENHLTHL